jgi:hypothetical protein
MSRLRRLNSLIEALWCKIMCYCGLHWAKIAYEADGVEYWECSKCGDSLIR